MITNPIPINIWYNWGIKLVSHTVTTSSAVIYHSQFLLIPFITALFVNRSKHFNSFFKCFNFYFYPNFRVLSAFYIHLWRRVRWWPVVRPGSLDKRWLAAPLQPKRSLREPSGITSPKRTTKPPLRYLLIISTFFSRVTCDSLENRFKTPLPSLATSDSPVVITHTFSFYFREEHVWPPRLMLLRHQRGNLLPSSLRKSRRRSEKHGETVTPPNFLLTLSFTLNIRFYIFP